MPLDGAFLSILRREIISAAADARVDKIAQPSRDEIILTLRWRGGGDKLLLSANPSSARVHFTKTAPENPKSPPMFCMLLRKHLMSARLAGIEQIGLDRVIHFRFETRNELGDLVPMTVAMEIMGRHSNIILVDQHGIILDAIKRVDPEMSSVRQVLPGMRYELPPPQDKLNPLDADTPEILTRLERPVPSELSKALIAALQGVSPIVSREIAHFANRGEEKSFQEMDQSRRERLAFYLGNWISAIRQGQSTPTMVIELSGRPKDFSYIPIRQYGAAMATKEMESASALLDAFYARRDQMERMRQRGSDLLRVLSNAGDRISRKLANQRLELEECGSRDALRIKGDLLGANLYSIQKGDGKAVVQNFYDPDGADIEITLDVMLTPAQNAQRYYALYRKADTAEKMLKTLIIQGEQELVYIDTVFDALTRADSEAALEAIRKELAESGYSRRQSTGKQKRESALPPLEYRSTDGYTIYSGRNNLQNDKLTLKDSRGYDLWLHTQKIAGSHTIIVSQGADIPKSTIEQACIIAAYNSRAQESTKVPVDYTFVRNVKKPNGARPGMVIYDRFETAIVDPDGELVASLLVR